MRIKKVINNNVLSVIDEDAHELIVTGKGIGFKRKTGEFIDPAMVEATYRMEDKGTQRKLRELVGQIPTEHLKLTQEMVDHIRQEIAQPLNESLLITLSDHISFAVRRNKEGLEFRNPLQGDIMCYYPAEYRLGQYCLRIIREKLGVDLNESEASFIALHIVNAELNTDMSEMYDITRLIDEALEIVEYYYQKSLTANHWISTVLSFICVTLPRDCFRARHWRTERKRGTQSSAA